MADASSVSPGLATLGGSGWTPTNDPRYGGSIPATISCTWSNRPTTGLIAGQMIFVGDVGEFGTVFQWTGTRWRVMNGQATLKTLAAPTGNIANTETIVMQALLPAGSWQLNDVLRVRNLSLSKSGTTDAGNLSVRIGTAGTVADTVITGLSALAVISAANRSYGSDFDIKLLAATSAMRLGSVQAGTFAGGAATAASAATAISDASINALFVSVTIASGGATDTVAAQSGAIQLITP